MVAMSQSSLLIPDAELLRKWSTNSREICQHVQNRMELTSNVSHLLPLLFRYNGRPVTLDRHFVLETAFYHNRPRRMILKCARQVGKSFQQALLVILRAMLIPNWNLLYITPLFEQVRRFSTLYIRGLIDESPVKRLLKRKGASSQVLQRTFGNNSTLFFNYAQRDANRTRGINSNENFYDEVQLMTRDVIEILQQTMGGSLEGEYESFAGTPLSFGNVIDEFYRDSTQSEWMVKCRSCGYENRAGVEFDLLKMIGPVYEDISPGENGKFGKPGLVCARCSKTDKGTRGIKPIFTEDGRWFHRVPERRDMFLGLHIPQPIMPWHAYSRDRWTKLNNRLAHGSEGEVFNEILGESADTSFKPISINDLKRAAVLGFSGHDVHAAKAFARKYQRLAMGIDWGGGGTDGLSRTKAAIMGFKDGKTDVLYGIDMNFSHRAFEEVKILLMIASMFGVELIAADAGGIGATRTDMLWQTGVLQAELWPMTYVGAIKNAIIRRHDESNGENPAYYTIDKSHSIQFTCQAIKQGHLRFFDYDFHGKDNPGLMHDFLALTSEVAHRVMGSDVLIIDREQGKSDDFAHAVNLGCCAGWSFYDAWPQVSKWNEYASLNELANMSDAIGGAEVTPAEVEAALRLVKTQSFSK